MTMECLESLQKLNYPEFEVILVDNGSQDGSVEQIKARFPETTFIANLHNLGYSQGNNVGIEHALLSKSQYILLLNNDTVVDPDMLSLLVEAVEAEPQIGIAGPTMFYFDPPDILWSGENYIDWHRSEVVKTRMGERLDTECISHQDPVAADYIDSCAILVRREVFEKIGRMDARYFINYDDLDLNVRARKAGYKIVYVPQARMWHKISAAMGIASPGTTYYMTRNSLLFFWTHAEKLTKIWNLGQILYRTSRTVLAWSLKQEYQTDIYRRRRAANLYAVRDFFLGRFGKMGVDVENACKPRS
jgi:GT2 family glycosyltransferase